MTGALAIAVLMLSAADHWTTWLCLRGSVAGWQVTEANPIADWLFTHVGLVPGLLVDSVVTVAALAFLVRTRRLPAPVKLSFLGAVIVMTGFAVANNLEAMRHLGLPLSPLG